jgi:arylsulfatase A-like enzyme
MEMDATVGDVMAALERTGLANDTLILFTSDNGPENWNYEEARDAKHYAMGGLRGVKRHLWEGGHRVPFIARWPGRISPGSTCAIPICHVDAMATCAEITGFSLPNDAAEDSQSILHLLTGGKPAGPAREGIVHHGADGRLAIRKDHWVLIESGKGGGGEPDWFRKERGYEPHTLPGELYDLARDPAERRNLYGEHPGVVADLKALLARYRNDGRSVPPR